MFIDYKKLTASIEFARTRGMRHLAECEKEITVDLPYLEKLAVAKQLAESRLATLSNTFIEHKKFHVLANQALEDIRNKYHQLETKAKKQAHATESPS